MSDQWIYGKRVDLTLRPTSDSATDDVAMPIGAGEPITLTGTWDDRVVVPPPLTRRVVIGEGVTLLGIDWWDWRMSFDATLDTRQERDGDVVSVSADMRPIGDVVTERAEWWRRLGYRFVARPIARLLGRLSQPLS